MIDIRNVNIRRAVYQDGEHITGMLPILHQCPMHQGHTFVVNCLLQGGDVYKLSRPSVIRPKLVLPPPAQPHLANPPLSQPAPTH